MTVTISSEADHDAAIAEKGVHHEQPTGTDWAAADIVEKGYASTPWLTPSYIGFYPLEEDSGSTANEQGGNASDGTINGMTLGNAAPLGFSSVAGDETESDNIDIPREAVWNKIDYSMGFWGYRTGTSDTQWVFSNNNGFDDGVTTFGYHFGALRLEAYEGGNDNKLRGGSVPSGEWFYMGFSMDGSNSNADIYLATGTGWSVSNPDSSTSWGVGDPSGGANIKLGRSDARGSSWGGRLWSAMVFDGVLTQSDHQELVDAVI